jgi:hypothetical protein
MAQRTGAVVVLKVARTVVAAPDGNCRHQSTGTPRWPRPERRCAHRILVAFAAAKNADVRRRLRGRLPAWASGDLAHPKKTFPLRASEIIDYLSSAFRSLGEREAGI